MFNQISSEALHSAKYVYDYLDAVENLPNEVQRLITRIRELDVKHRSYLRDVDLFYSQWANCSTNELETINATKRNRAMTRIQQSLVAFQEVGDEKLCIVQQLTELIEAKTKQLDHTFKALDYNKSEPFQSFTKDIIETTCSNLISISLPSQVNANLELNSSSINSALAITTVNNQIILERGSKRMRRGKVELMDTEIDETFNKLEGSIKPPLHSVASNANNKKCSTSTYNAKKKRKKTGKNYNQNRDLSAVEEIIDPDEPTYCLCDQISFGEMILCDNDLCPIEWFHFSCVTLTTKPKGKWFCPNCRGERPNVMKPKAQFLKELERYNKEKEEKL